MVIVIFSRKIKKSHSDNLHLYEMIELQHFAQLATQIQAFSKQKSLNIQDTSFSKSLIARLFMVVSYGVET